MDSGGTHWVFKICVKKMQCNFFVRFLNASHFFTQKKFRFQGGPKNGSNVVYIEKEYLLTGKIRKVYVKRTNLKTVFQI